MKLLLAALFSLALSQISPVDDPASCSSSSYFDTANLSCTACGTGETPASDKLSCECLDTYQLTSGALFDKTCDNPCTANSRYFDSTSTSCLACPTANADSATCTCLSGFVLTSGMTCVNCAAGEYPSNEYTCSPCPPDTESFISSTTCTCASSYTQSSTICIEQSGLSAISGGYQQLGKTNYRSINKLGETSSTFEFYALEAAYLCSTQNNPESCNALANLCALSLYDFSFDQCNLALGIEAASTTDQTGYAGTGWKSNRAWLQYAQSADSVLKDSSKVGFNVALQSTSSNFVSQLDIKLASYLVNGTFVGWQDMGQQMLLCPTSYTNSLKFLTFAHNQKLSCEFTVSSLFEAPRDQMYIYSPWLQSPDGTMIDVPVLIRQLRTSTGDTPNTSSDMNSWQLVRRFFVTDTLSGMTTTYPQSGVLADSVTPINARYAKSITLHVEMQSSGNDKIYVPYLEIDYAEVNKNSITNEVVTVQSLYTADYSTFRVTAIGFFVATLAISVLVSIWRICVWVCYNPNACRNGRSCRCFFDITYIVTHSLALFLFWMGYFLTMYLFISSKLQQGAFVLLPASVSSDEYTLFAVFFGLVLFFRAVTLLYSIVKQIKLDVFFIDWENPRTLSKEEQASAYPEAIGWRKIFIANEFNELQLIRLISPLFTLLFFLVFYEGLGWVYTTSESPETNHSSSLSKLSFVLKYFLASSLFLAIGVGQYLMKWLLKVWFPLKIQEFTDLCSVSNISAFILYGPLHGYYVHGQSPVRMGDLKAEDLKKALDLEKQGQGHNRGLVETDRQALQTFELIVPLDLREVYDENLRFRDKKMRMYAINENLKYYIERVKETFGRSVVAKTACQRFLRLPPSGVKQLRGTPLLIRDDRLNFKNVTLHGLEFDFLYLWILLFLLWEEVSGNAYVGVLLVWMVDYLVVLMRDKLGKRNVSKKSLIPSIFLL